MSRGWSANRTPPRAPGKGYRSAAAPPSPTPVSYKDNSPLKPARSPTFMPEDPCLCVFPLCWLHPSGYPVQPSPRARPPAPSPVHYPSGRAVTVCLPCAVIDMIAPVPPVRLESPLPTENLTFLVVRGSPNIHPRIYQSLTTARIITYTKKHRYPIAMLARASNRKRTIRCFRCHDPSMGCQSQIHLAP